MKLSSKAEQILNPQSDFIKNQTQTQTSSSHSLPKKVPFKHINTIKVKRYKHTHTHKLGYDALGISKDGVLLPAYNFIFKDEIVNPNFQHDLQIDVIILYLARMKSSVCVALDCENLNRACFRLI